MWGVRSDLSFAGLMKLVENVVGVNSEIDDIELHALISTPRELSWPIIKDDEDVALILLEQRNVSAVYVSIKGPQTNVMSHEEVEQHGNQLNQNEIHRTHIPQHSVCNPQQWQLKYAQEFVQPSRHTTFIEQLAAQFRSGCASNQLLASVQQMQRSGETVECVMPLSNENTTPKDNIVRLEGDSMTLEDNTTSDKGNEDLLPVVTFQFCNNVEGKMEPVKGVDVGDAQCDDPIYNNPIASENGIRSLDTLLDDSYQERRNARISHMWLIAGAERFFFQTIIIEESTCADDRLYKGRMFSSKVELKRVLNMLYLKEQFGIRVKKSCKGHYEVGYMDKACKFSVRATKLPDRGEYWQVQTFHEVHTCTVDGLQGRFSTASAKIIGELMSHKLRANGVTLRPKDIICEMRVQWGLECLYGKAWQTKEYVERLVFSPSEESFQLLASYFYMLEQENLDIVTTVATDEAERFKYCF
ncbi:Transposase [Theobroma cacao]|nr:Transposase [Theobroma cacao]